MRLLLELNLINPVTGASLSVLVPIGNVTPSAPYAISGFLRSLPIYYIPIELTVADTTLALPVFALIESPFDKINFSA